MLHISHKCLTVDEPCSQTLRHSELPSPIVADVNDKGIAWCEIHQHVVKVAVANGCIKR